MANRLKNLFKTAVKEKHLREVFRLLNKVILIGRLTANPELSRTKKEHIAVTNFTLAIERNFENKYGKKQTDFIPIKTWRKLAENCSKHLGKGRRVAVEGQIRTGLYKDKSGKKQKSFEVVADNVRFLDWPKDKDQGQMDMYPYPDVPF